MVNLQTLFGNTDSIYESIISEAMFRTRCAIPAIVQSYNPDKNTVDAQPAIRERLISEDGSVYYKELPLLINVPVVFPRTGTCGITFRLKQNDECLIIFSDLSIDNFWVSGSIQNPVEVRRHDLSDGIAIPCTLSQPSIGTIPENLTIKQGNSFVELSDSEIKFSNGSKTVTLTQLLNHYHVSPSDGGNTSTPKY